MNTLKPIHTFERNGKYFAIDVQNTFCFECDEITHDILQYYPENAQNKILHILSSKYSKTELLEVWGELEWLRSIGSILKHQKIETWANALTQNIGLDTLSFLIKKDQLEQFQKIMPSALLRALPQVKTQQKFRINLIFAEKINTFKSCYEVISELLSHIFPLNEKNININLCLPITNHIRETLKISRDEKIFFIFENTTLELLQRLDTYGENEFSKLLNEQRGKVLFLPTFLPFIPTIEKFLNSGIKRIVLDPFAPFILNPEINIADFFHELTDLTILYTQQLKKGNQYLLAPVMEYFLNIQHGNSVKRRDPAGAEEWFITPDGDVYGGYLYYKNNLCRLGNIQSSDIPITGSESVYSLGINTTPLCTHCWAKNICGGGCGAVHHQLSGKVTEPCIDWCNLQREWIEEIIVQYQELNNAGVSLSPDVQVNTEKQHPGRLTVLKHIFQGLFKEQIVIRPLRPQDEEWLCQWETWNENVYFTLNEGNILTTTQHEKEQEILNPNKTYEEWAIIDKKSNPRGLLKIQPHRIPNLAIISIYFHNSEDYDNRDIQESFQNILNQVKNRFPKKHWLIPVIPEDKSLIQFVEALNFHKAGTARDSFFLHKKYHHLDIYLL
ncbi:MAG TPA: SPASM domain-containing protein [Candidatus Hydrogenedens sp.]|nr:SPASM domain-containing protein [Candidatus Hydrogenedens sp.]